MKITVIGAGAMGGAVVEGLLMSNFTPELITVTAKTQKTLDKYVPSGVRTQLDNKEAVHGADVVLLAVKPWIVPEVVDEVKTCISERTIVVLLAAGIPSAQFRAMFDNGVEPKLVVAIPNTAAAVRKSITFVVSINAEAEDVSKVVWIFDQVGTTMVIDEAHLPAATALASCGIAFAMRYIRAASEGGVELGFKADVAKEIVIQTVAGAAALLHEQDIHPEAAIDRVTTPGGITIRGLNEMEHSGFTSSVINGLKACVKK